MALLRYMSEQGQVETASLADEPFVIGRGPSCQIVFVSDMVSREHARIEREDDGRYRIRDMGSRNKTSVNGQIVSETLLTPGDIVRIGDRVIEYVGDDMTRDKIDMTFLTPDRHEPAHADWIKPKTPLSLTTQQVGQLARLACDTGLTSRPEDIADGALGRLILDVSAERGFVAVRGERKKDLRPIAHRALTRMSGESLVPVSESFVYAALLQSVAGRYPQTNGQIDADSGYAATGLVAPVTFRGEVVGIVYVDRPGGKKAFPASAAPYIAAAGAHLGAQMAEASRKLLNTGLRDAGAWLTTARRLQAALTCEVRGSDTFDVAMTCMPGRVRCGDFCDVIHADEHRCAVVVVDGGGRGTSGLAQAAAICASIRTALTVSDDALMAPAELFDTMNRMVAGSRARQVVPCTYIGIDLASGKAAYINAGGMPPLLMVAPGRLVTLDQASLVLGVDADFTYEATRVDLSDVFRVVCHTDGLTEATNGAGDALGDQRLHDTLLDREAFQGVEAVVEKLRATWQMHLAGAEPDDDAMCVVVGHG
ncbi:MAG: SpoIIE family protein phosphatase [Phycisphaerae bacterium]